MKEMVKSKSIIGFVIFVLGVVYINTPSLSYSDENQEILDSQEANYTYNI